MIAVSYGRYVLLKKKSRLTVSSRYLEHTVNVTKHFLKTFGKKFSPKMRFWHNIPARFWASFFSNRNFFQKILENYSRALRTYSMYLFNLVLYSSKKIMTIRHTNQIVFYKKWKKLIFEKMKLKLGWNTLIKVFLCENFGKVSLENFLLTLQEFSKHLKILLSQVVCVSKSIVTIKRNNKKYHSKTKQTKRTIFLSLISWHDCSSESFELVRIPIDFLKIWS